MKVMLPLPEEAHGIAAVHVGAWQQAYASILPRTFLDSLSIEAHTLRWKTILDARESTTLVAKPEPGVVAGFVSYARCRDDDAPSEQGEIWSLYVLPAFWGREVGRLLLGHALTGLQKAGYASASLWVLSKNKRARGFYRAAGFKTVPKSSKRFKLGGIEVEEVRLLRRCGAAPLNSALVQDK